MKIKQVLINIITNATKFTVNGTIELRVTSDQEYILFVISDTGIGMAESQIKSLFESYTQFKEDRNVEGTGLGMAICKQFSELMNGSISVESKPKKGTVFTLKLPKDYKAL